MISGVVILCTQDDLELPSGICTPSLAKGAIENLMDVESFLERNWNLRMGEDSKEFLDIALFDIPNVIRHPLIFSSGLGSRICKVVLVTRDVVNAAS